MSIFEKLFNRQKEERYFFPVEYTNFFGGSYSGEENPVVAKCVNKIVNTLGTLDMHLYSYSSEGKKELFNHSIALLLKKPSTEESKTLFYQTLIRRLLLEGNVYLYKGYSNNNVVSLTICSGVLVSRDARNKKIYTIGGKVYTDKEILHIPYPVGYNGTIGESPVSKYKELISTYNLLMEYINKYFHNSLGTRYSLELDPTNYSSRSTDTAKVYAALLPVINKYVNGAENAGKVMIPPPGSKLQKIDQGSNVQAELSSLITFLEQQICGIFSVPYELISSENKYGALEERQRQFLQNCINPLGKHISQCFESLLSYSDYNLFIQYDYLPMLETDVKSTIDYLSKEIQSGILTINEARRKLNLSPIDKELGDIYFIQSNLMPLTKENIDSYLGSAKAKLAHFSGGDDKG